MKGITKEIRHIPLILTSHLFLFISAIISRINFRHAVGSGGTIAKYTISEITTYVLLGGFV